MVKNIVICLDGTGNQIEENLSNVLKLYRALQKNDQQIVYYDQGVGTLGRRDNWGRFRQWLIEKIIAMGLGIGLDKNVIRAYEFLIRHHQDGDRIFLFGYSRGAHTARVLAGLIYEIGILRPEQINLSGAALTAYKQARLDDDAGSPHADEDTYEGEGANFKRVAQPKLAAIEFMGLWDTVSSVIIPNYKNFWPPVIRETLPHTANNPAVRTLRQAAAIDERRRMFRLDPWDPGQLFQPNPHTTGHHDPQDAAQMWFAGAHGDVGGGHPRKESGLSQIPLIWMLDEAGKSQLKIYERMAKYVTGQKSYSSATRYLYPEPEPAGQLHKSLKGLWWVLEFFPKMKKLREWPKRKALFGFYFPLGEPRFLPDDANIHPSVFKRISGGAHYRPVNFPDAQKPPDW